MEERVMYVPEQEQAPQGVQMPFRSDKADMLDKITPEKVIEAMRHKLMGEDLDPNGQWIKVQALQKYALTDRGAWEISNLLLGVSTRSMSISKIKEKVIIGRLKRIAKDAQLMMISNWKEYGVKDVAQFYFVHSLVMGNAIAVLYQAGDGSIQELLKGTTFEQRNLSTTKAEPGKLKRAMNALMGQE